MTETLTESFCERCGTRYEFKAPTRLNPLRKTRGFMGGLKNYLTSQDDMSDAMRDAMRQQEEALASAQLEAFHESFNFCIDCRQYTCVNCWNDGAGRCRSCAPIAGTDDLAERLAASMAANGSVAVAEPELAEGDLQHRLGFEAWPSSDLPAEPSNGHRADIAWPDADATAATWTTPDQPLEPEPEPVVAEEPEPEPVVAQEPEPEPVVTQEPEPEPVVAQEPEPEPVVAEEPEPVVAEQPEPEPITGPEAERPPLRVVAWEPDAPYDVIAPEPMVAEEPEPVVALEPEPEPVVAQEPEPVVALEPEPEPVVAEEPQPEPVVAEEPEPEPELAPRPRLAPISETILHFPERAAPTETRPERPAAADDTPEVAARRAQLDMLGLGDPGEGPVEPDRPAVMPYRSRGAAARQGSLGGRAARTGGGFWEASAREVAGAAASIGVQNCGQCGLSLSANARFCRRCGTRQAQSA